MQNRTKSKGRKGQKGRHSRYDISFRRKVANEYSEGDRTMLQVAQHYGVTKYNVKDWVRQFPAELAVNEQPTSAPMTEQEQQELQALQKQVAALKKKLEHEQMKNFALEIMIDMAKEELGVDVRKNSGAKQPGE